MARSLMLAAVLVFGWTSLAEAQFGFSFGGSQRNNGQGGNQGFGPTKPNPPRFQGPNNSGQFNNQPGFNNNNNPFGGLIGAVANAAAQAQQQQQFQPQNQFRPQFQPSFNQPQFDQFQGDGFVQPQFRSTPIAPQAASVEATPAPTYSNLPIVLRCSSSAVNQCNYKLTEATGVSYPYNIAPGKKQVFKETTRWELSFDRGDGQLLRYTLSGGEIYELKQVDGLWVCHCES